MRRISWTLCGIAIATTLGVALSVKPWRAYNEQRAKRDEAVAEMRQAERDRAEEMERLQRLQTPFGKEEEARRLGYRRPDEKPISVSP